jgi:hypothetical protein
VDAEVVVLTVPAVVDAVAVDAVMVGAVMVGAVAVVLVVAGTCLGSRRRCAAAPAQREGEHRTGECGPPLCRHGHMSILT